MRMYFLGLGTLMVVCLGCVADGQHVSHNQDYVAPPAAQLAAPGPMVAGPGPGVLGPMGNGGHIVPVGHHAPAYGPGPVAGPVAAPANEKTQVRFLGPEGMVIGWQSGPTFAEAQLITPGRYNFPQAATYRLKLSDIPGREGLELYPTLEVYPSHISTAAYLAHNTVPVRFTDEDLSQVETNNMVTKVIYLPDPQFQELAVAGVEELVSTRLDLGQDPVAEADRRGTIMAVIRMGNVDVEMPGEAGIPLGVHGIGGIPNLTDADREEISKIKQVQAIEVGGTVAPTPIATHTGNPLHGVPSAQIVAAQGAPGAPVGMPVWGMPITGTPIGLPGPAHIPLGKPAGLRSHTMRNLSDVHVGGPVEDLLIDVRHEPGIRLPNPVRHIQYTESHPHFADGVRSYPATLAP